MLRIGWLLCWLALGWAANAMFSAAPEARHLLWTRVTAGDGPVLLGYRELGQRPDGARAAERHHVRVTLRDGRWWIANVALRKRVDAPGGGRNPRFLKRWRLTPGDRLWLDGIEVTVLDTDATTLHLRSARGGEAHWRDGHLETGVPPFAGCPEEGAAWWKRWLAGPRGRELLLFTLGGQVPCARRWPLPGVPSGGARVVWAADAFWLAPGRAEVRMARAGEKKRRAFSDLALPVGEEENAVQRVYLGRGGYELKVRNGDLWWIPLTGSDLFTPDEVLPQPGDPRVEVRYSQATAGADGGLFRWFWLGWAGWLVSGLVTAWRGRLRGTGGGLWVCAALLSGIGVLTLAQLALGGDSTRWLRFAQGQAQLWTAYGWFLLVPALLPANGIHAMLTGLFTGQARLWKLLRRGLPALGALLLTLQLFAGGEQGVAGVQPAEAAKLLLVLLLGYGGMRLYELRLGRGRAFRERPLRFALGALFYALLFLAVASALLWAVHDMSPVLILLLVVAGVTWRIAPGPRGAASRTGWLLRGVLVLGLVALGALAWQAHQRPEAIPAWLPQYQRLQVWADPGAHPHSGMQVREAMAFAGAGGWIGALASPWGWNGEVMRLPAVQDDFIAAFLLYRFGALAGLVLLALQWAFLGLLFHLADELQTAWVGTQRPAGLALSLALHGIAWLFAAHWLIAWGNVLGLLPVMGQPMTWLAAGNSHLAFFAYPALTLALLAAWARPRRPDHAA